MERLSEIKGANPLSSIKHWKGWNEYDIRKTPEDWGSYAHAILKRILARRNLIMSEYGRNEIVREVIKQLVQNGTMAKYNANTGNKAKTYMYTCIKYAITCVLKAGKNDALNRTGNIELGASIFDDGDET